MCFTARLLEWGNTNGMANHLALVTSVGSTLMVPLKGSKTKLKPTSKAIACSHRFQRRYTNKKIIKPIKPINTYDYTTHVLHTYTVNDNR